MKGVGVIVAGGSGSRMTLSIRKQYLVLGNRPVLVHALAAFDACEAIEAIYLVVPAADMEFCRKQICPASACRKPVHLVAGGQQRQDSVFAGLSAAKGHAELVAIHDGVRPFILPAQIAESLAQAGRHGACILATPASETLKECAEKGWIARTLDRGKIWMAQTPQTFRFDLIHRAHLHARVNGLTATDDAQLVEIQGLPVALIPGSPLNIKITRPEDLLLAEAILRMWPPVAA